MIKVFSFRNLLTLFLFSSFYSCAGIHKSSITPSITSPAEQVPSPAAYYHTLLGLQYEKEENDSAALSEYLAALRDDPNAVFLLRRVAAALSRIGSQKDALSYAERAAGLRPDDIQTLYLLGGIYIASGQPEKASGVYHHIVEVQPKEIEAYFSLAGIYASQNNLKKTEEMVQKGIEADPNSPLGYYYLGKIAAERKAFEEALQYYQKALSLNGNFEHARLEMGHVYESQGNLEEAQKVYRKLLEEVNPGNREALGRLIQLLMRDQSFDEALKLLGDLAQEDPSNMDIPLQTALVWVEKKDYPRAIDKVLTVIQARPEDPRLKIYLAALYEENKEFDRAISIYQEVLEKDRTLYDVHLRLGALYFYKLKKAEEALAEGDFARKLDPRRPESYLFNGLVFYELNRYEEAVQTFRQGIEKNPKVPDLHFHLGATYDKLNRFDELVKEMKKTIELDSKYANALNYLGYTYADKGIHLNDAVDLINRALAVRPDDGYFIDSLGWAYYKKGMIPDAVATLQKAVRLVPEDPVIHEHLGEVYLKDNLTELAREEWTRSLKLDPKNEKLISRFKQAGFGDPMIDEKLQGAQKEPKERQHASRIKQMDLRRIFLIDKKRHRPLSY